MENDITVLYFKFYIKQDDGQYCILFIREYNSGKCKKTVMER